MGSYLKVVDGVKRQFVSLPTQNVSQIIAANDDRVVTLNTVYFLRNNNEVLVEHIDKVTADLERLGYTVSYRYD